MMRLTLTILLLYPLLLAAQCFGSFETFAAAGFSGTSSTLSTSENNFTPTPVVRFGFGASFAVGKRLFLRTGVQLSQYGDNGRTSDNDLRWGTQHDGVGGFDPNAPSGEPGGSSDRFTRHHYIEGILALRYELKSRGKLRPFVEGGMTIGAYTVTSFEGAEGDETGHGRINNFRSVSPTARLGFGLNYHLSDKVGFYAMPVGQYHLRSLDQSSGSLNLRSWQATLEVGVRVFVDPR